MIEESFAGTLAGRGFEEQLMRLKPKPAMEEAPGQFWKDFIRQTAPEFRKPTLEQIETLTAPIWAELIDGSKYVNRRLEEIFDTVEPDVIVQDNVVAFPAVLTAGVPWVRVVSCNPLEIADPSLPPALSGLPSGDRSEWARFRRGYRESTAQLHLDFDQFCRDHGCPPLPEGEFMYPSPFLNCYVYPDELDYPRERPLNETWERLESCVRRNDPAFQLPDGWKSPLIYLSLGSLGSADTGLMSRLIDVLGATAYRVIVSLGPQHQELRLAPNMIGAEFLPQTSILPLVDLVITHGGNNTVTESVYFGKPMIALPLFWDQHDNAQRLQETGFGVRLHAYEFLDDELVGAIDRLLGDEALKDRLQGTARRLQAKPGTVQAAELIERVSRSRLPAAARS
ncbi:MAG TPA: nucleotide disphospho-sugar-binding domain-containing protein [Candidatus Dormibacteraeota bacterium]|nr:nucleotide disphospho-sugar-binding domain-containing protein [Candidatus Dormibacteraeota bacterium]